MSKVIFSIEPFSDKLFVESLPLLQAHYEELMKDQNVPLSPDIQRYYLLAQNGMLQIVTGRTEEGVLVGYAVNHLQRGLHYSTINFATNDVIFIRKDHRRGTTGIRLLQYMEEELKKIGINIICMHVKPEPDFGPILKRLGYNFWESIYKKRIN